VLAAQLRQSGVEVVRDDFFDTVLTKVPGRADAVVEAARAAGINLRRVDADHVGIACDETTTRARLRAVCEAFGATDVQLDELDANTPDALPTELLRTSEYLTHPVFHRHQSET